MKRERLLWAGVLALGALAAALVLSPLGLILLGWLRGEAFFDGKPTSYWVSRLANPETHVEAIDELAQGKGAALPVLLEAMHSEDVAVRRRAAVVLGQIGPEAREAIGPLSELLKDPDATVRSYAAMALGVMGRGAEEAVPALKGALRDDAADVRKAAAVALRRITP
jgi:HEAT repeat protein